MHVGSHGEGTGQTGERVAEEGQTSAENGGRRVSESRDAAWVVADGKVNEPDGPELLIELSKQRLVTMGLSCGREPEEDLTSQEVGVCG